MIVKLRSMTYLTKLKLVERTHVPRLLMKRGWDLGELQHD